MESLQLAGLTPFRGPDYHTLVRDASQPIIDAAPSAFQIERVTIGSTHLNELGPSIRDAVGRPECDVWLAIEDSAVVGHGVATTVGSVTYLGDAGTAEPYRNRGAQTAIIRARLLDAERRGSQIAVSETLSMLGSSLRNLQRAK